MATILLDDVTLRVIVALGLDPAGWCADLPTREPREAIPRSWDQAPTGSWIALRLRGRPVHGTAMTLAKGIRYTRGTGQPGPQLILQGGYGETMLAALTGGPATRVAEHPALVATKIERGFSAGGYTYLDVATPMHQMETGRDLDHEGRLADIEVDRMLAARGSRSARQRLGAAGAV